MNSVRRLVSGILVVMLVPVLSAIMVVSALSGVVGIGGGSEEAKAKAVAAAMREPVIEAVAMYVSDSEEGWDLPEDDVRAALSESLGEEQLLEVSTSLSVAMEHAAAGDGPTMVRLGDLVEALLTGLRRVVEQKMATLPVCTKEQLAELAAMPPDELPDCRSADAAVNRAVLDRFFTEFRAQIPEEIDLGLIREALDEAETGALPMPATATMAAMSAGPSSGLITVPLQLVGFVSSWGWLTAAALILGLIALNFDRWYRPFGWLGWAFLLSSVTPLLLAVSAPLAFSKMSGEDAMAARIAQSLLQAPLGRARTLGLIAAGLGIACIIVAMVGARRRRA